MLPKNNSWNTMNTGPIHANTLLNADRLVLQTQHQEDHDVTFSREFYWCHIREQASIQALYIYGTSKHQMQTYIHDIVTFL
jgi:hypothetical protein